MMQLAGEDMKSLAAGQDEWPRHILWLREQVEEVLSSASSHMTIVVSLP
jgi:hypothetical protein